MRNGAYVRQKFEEATKSHGLEKWSVQFIVQVITVHIYDDNYVDFPSLSWSCCICVMNHS
jgi:hypothetical protein